MSPQTQVNQGRRAATETRTTVTESYQEVDLRATEGPSYKGQGLNENRGKGAGAPEPDFSNTTNFNTAQGGPGNQANFRRDILPQIRRQQEAERANFVAENAARQAAHREGYQNFVADNAARSDYHRAAVNGANSVRRDLTLAKQAGCLVPDVIVPRPGEYREYGHLPRTRAFPAGSAFRRAGDVVSGGVEVRDGKVRAAGGVVQIGGVSVAGSYHRHRR